MEAASGRKRLSLHPLRRSLDRRFLESELEQPGAGCRLSVDFGGRELPSLRRLEGLIREISAGAGRFQFCCSDFSGRIYFYPYDHLDGASDSILRAAGNLRKNLANDLAPWR